MALSLVLVSCTEIVDFGRVVAIDVRGPATPVVEEGDTLRFTAWAVSAAGDSVPDAVVVWEAVRPDTAPETVSVDATGLVSGLAAGPGFIQARHRTLTTPLIAITVTARPDTVFASTTRIVVPAGDTTSTALVVSVAAFPDTGLTLVPLASIPVRFVLAEPTVGGAIRLAASDGTPVSPGDTLATSTGQAGTAGALVQVVGTPVPDSAVVHALALTARNDMVAGSPIQFVVVFP